MESFFKITLTILYAMMWMAFIMLVRNNNVRNFRSELLDRINFVAKTRDIPNNLPFEWRYEMYDTVPYDYMVITFWRKLTPEKYYSDTSFLH